MKNHERMKKKIVRNEKKLWKMKKYSEKTKKNIRKPNSANILSAIGFQEISFRIHRFPLKIYSGNVHSEKCARNFDCEPNFLQMWGEHTTNHSFSAYSMNTDQSILKKKMQKLQATSVSFANMRDPVYTLCTISFVFVQKIGKFRFIVHGVQTFHKWHSTCF